MVNRLYQVITGLWCYNSLTLTHASRRVMFRPIWYKFHPWAILKSNITWRIHTLSASGRAYQAFPHTRRITVRASGKWTTARYLIGYPLTNKIPPRAFLRAISALDWAVIHNKHLESVSLQVGLFLVLTPGTRRIITFPACWVAGSVPQKLHKMRALTTAGRSLKSNQSYWSSEQLVLL